MKIKLFENKRILQVVFIILTCFSILAIILFGLGIKYYPRGHIVDPYNDDFNFLYNPMSDLGRVQAYNGGINIISIILYSIALTLLAIIIFIYYSIIWKFFQKYNFTKNLSIIGTAFGMLQSISYIVLAYSPGDTRFPSHIKSIYVGSALLVAAILSYTIVFFVSKEFPKINTYSFLAMMIIAVAHAMSVTLGSFLGEPLFSFTRRGGNTLFIFIVTIIYCLQGIGAYYYIIKKV